MSQNPYAAQQEPDGYDEWADDAPRRTSLSAVASVLCSIPCCFVPGMGVLGIALGAASLAFIKQSRGRLSGGPAAITGIFLGLMTSVIWGGIGFGAAQGYAYWNNTMRPEAAGLISDASAGDWGAARSRLTSDAAADVSDARLQVFIEAIEDRVGTNPDVTADVGLIFQTFGRIYGQQGQTGQSGAANAKNVAPVPFALQGSRGTAIFWAIFDEDSFARGAPKLDDAMVVFEGRRAVALREDGFGAELGRALAEELIGQADEESSPAGEGGDDGSGGAESP